MSNQTEIRVEAPNFHTVLGPSIERYPDGYMYPVTVLVRQSYVDHPKAFDAGATFKVPGYGVLVTKSDRSFVFTPTDAYRAAKGYEERIEGRW